MDLSRMTGGGTPLVTNINVQGTVAIAEGAIITVSILTTTAQGCVVTATTSSAANDNTIGVTQVSTSQASASPENVNNMSSYRFNIGTDGIPNEATTVGGDWLPTCINPDAMYYALHSVTVTTGTLSASDPIVDGITASTGTVVTLTSTSNIGVAGGWLMDGGGVSSAAGTPTFSGQLRMVTNVTAVTKFGLVTAMNVSTDSCLVHCSPQNYKATVISSGGNFLRSRNTGDAAGRFNQGLLCVDNYVTHQAAPLHPLRYWVDNGLNGLSGQRLYSEVLISKFYSRLNA